MKILFLFLVVLVFCFPMNAQNVGISTLNPLFKLDVRNGSINTDSVYRIGTYTVLSVLGTNTLFLGKHAGNNNSGSDNTFSGTFTGHFNTTGFSNSFYGAGAGYNNTQGFYNSFFGAYTGFYNTTGKDNSFFGMQAGPSNTTGNANSFFGRTAGLSNSVGHSNSFFGMSAGFSNNTGNNNSFFGDSTGFQNTTGTDNTFMGKWAGYYNSTGNSNSFFGQSAGGDNSTGYSNSFFGQTAGIANSIGFENSFFGFYSGIANTSGFDNSFFGSNTGNQNQTGSKNSFFGKYAGYGNTTGIANTAIGYSSFFNTGDLTNATAIGNNTRVDCSNCMVLGSVNGVNGATSGVNVGIGTTIPVLLFQVAKNTSYGTGNSYGIAATNATNTNLRLNLGYDAMINAGVIQASEEGVSFNKNLLLNPNAGNVGIGTTTPIAKLDVNGTLRIIDGTQGAGKILTSDATGLASWQPPPPPPPVNYSVVWICCNPWMTKNLDVSTYKNGDPIPKVTDGAAWSALTTGAYCYYNNDSTTYASTYGKLYNWYAVNDPRGLAPNGWHIPTDLEWTTLSTCLGGDGVAGGPMKEIGTTHWTTPNTGGTNISGFKTLPGGDRNPSGLFTNISYFGFWWSATESEAGYAWVRYLINSGVALTRYSESGVTGFSVRCLRD